MVGQTLATRSSGRETDFDFSRFYQEVENGGVTHWRPRVVAVDKKGSLGAARTVLSADQAEVADIGTSLWGFGVETHRADPTPSHTFQEDLALEDDGGDAEWDEAEDEDEYEDEDVDENVSSKVAIDQAPSVMRSAEEYNFSETSRTWTDFLKVRLPSTYVHELHCCHHEVTPFSSFFDGLALRGRLDEEEVCDLVRKQMELCDQLDAVHALLDVNDGFGGVASLVLRFVQEEQPKCGKLVVSSMLGEPDPTAKGGHIETDDGTDASWANAALSYASVLSMDVDASVIVPVPLWSVQEAQAWTVNRTSRYEVGAVIAAAVENVSFPYRLRGSGRPSQFLSSLTPSHRPTCGILEALPLPVIDSAVTDPRARTREQIGVCEVQSEHFFDLTSMIPVHSNPFVSVVVRGAEPSRLLRLCEGMHSASLQRSFVDPAPLPLPVPFPQFFSPKVSSKGLFRPDSVQPARHGGQEVAECPVATYLHASAAAGKCTPLTQMASILRAQRRSAWAAAAQAQHGAEPDDLAEAVDVLVDHAECAAADDEDDSNMSDGSL